MSSPVSHAAAFVIALACVAALPLIARSLRADAGDRCALDSVAIDARDRVRLVDASGTNRSFCCVDCAQLWAGEPGRAPREVFVTDETSGAELPACAAWFVRSTVEACAATRCRIHVFGHESDARRHAAAFDGLVLEGEARPLRGAR